MNAELSTMIGGQPMLVIRKFLRQVGNASWGVSYVRRLFDFDESEARELVDGLAIKGYIKKSEHAIGSNWWEVSAAGKRVAQANGTRKISKEAAKRIVSALLQRAVEVNASDTYLFRVKKITAFGSYVEGDSTIDDIDVEIGLERKESDHTTLRLAVERKVAEEKSKGRTFASQAEEIEWGEMEVLLLLKARSRYLNFIRIPSDWRTSLPSATLFDGAER